ncbi:MAG: hypothetical protein DHS20C11_23970 [Lysobacteraceae bacterium]|nr:MAG: hypothetical protein DHS20C11_23970 [Xanthomonadaceae bacterium]
MQGAGLIDMSEHQEKDRSSLNSLLLQALLWLPLGFFVWFAIAPLLVIPVTQLTRFLVLELLPHAATGVVQTGFRVEILTLISPPPAANIGRDLGMISLTLNPMLYGYGLPLVFGLIMSIQLPVWRRVRQVIAAYLVIVLVQTWGTAAELFKTMAFELGAEGAHAMERTGISPDAIALGYQFGYLILPAVVPVVFWMIANRDFIDEMVGSGLAGNSGGDQRSTEETMMNTNSTPPTEGDRQ